MCSISVKLPSPKPFRVLNDKNMEAISRINEVSRRLHRAGVHVTDVLDWHSHRPLIRVDTFDIKEVSKQLPFYGEITLLMEDGQIRHRAFLGECEVEWSSQC